MADPTSRKTVRPIRPIVPGRPVDVTLGGLDPDMEYVYDRLAALEGDAAQIGTINLPTGGYAQNDLLVFLNGQWTAVNKTALLALNDLTDVIVTGAVTGQFLVHEAGSWRNQNFSQGKLGIGTLVNPTHRVEIDDAAFSAWWTGISFATGSGAAGLNLSKDKTDTHPLTATYRSDGAACYDVGMDAATNNALRNGFGNADFVLLGDHSANAGAFADVLRYCPEEKSTLGATGKFQAGRMVGTPQANPEFWHFDGGDDVTPLSGVRIRYFTSDATRHALVLINRHSTLLRCTVNFHDRWGLGIDQAAAGGGANNFSLRDLLASAERWFVDSSGKMTIGGTTTAGRFLVPAAADATANYGVVSVGDGQFAGGAGQFVGSAGGTGVALNMVTGFGGNLIDLQRNGLSHFLVASTGQSIVVFRDAGATNVPAAFRLQHASTGVPASGFGVQQQYFGQDSGTTAIEIGNIQAVETLVGAGAANCAAYLSLSSLNLGTLVERARFHGDGRAGVAAGGANPLATGVLWNHTKTAVSNPSIKTYQQILAVADTALAAGVEASDVLWDLSRTLQFSTGALTNQRAVRILAPTYSFVAASTISAAATVYIDRAPQAGLNATLSSAYALWVNEGLSRFDGPAQVTHVRHAIATKTGAYTLTDSDGTILADASVAPFTLTLPTAVGRAGTRYTAKKIDASPNVVTIDGNGSETIDGGLTADLTLENESLDLQADGANWRVV